MGAVTRWLATSQDYRTSAHFSRKLLWHTSPTYLHDCSSSLIHYLSLWLGLKKYGEVISHTVTALHSAIMGAFFIATSLIRATPSPLFTYQVINCAFFFATGLTRVAQFLIFYPAKNRGTTGAKWGSATTQPITCDVYVDCCVIQATSGSFSGKPF